jgi:stage II sporulation protein D
MIQKKLGKKWRTKKALENIIIINRTPLGRVKTLGFADAQGRTIEMLAKDFRMLMGPDLIRSTNFSISFDTKENVVFSGKGWGHGVGLCQHGALGMAEEGYNYEDILKFYYPGAKINRMK